MLKLVANTLTANSRPFDVFGRWGGEEFIGIIRNIDRDELTAIGNRLRLLIANAYFMQNDIKLAVTISIGATLAARDDTPDTLLQRADALLYKSKTAGRNRLSSD